MDATSGHGAFVLTNGPLIADQAAIAVGGGGLITPTGDDAGPRFSRDAQLRLFTRVPLGHATSATTVVDAVLPVSDGKTVLFHTTDGSVFLNPIAAGVSPAGTETADKDIQELFLDEVYRYDSTFPGVIGADGARLVGPGLPAGPNPIPIPVRAGSAVAGYGISSWIQIGSHTTTLNATAEAQVSGLPDRSPPIQDGVVEPSPLAGMLLFPQLDYSVGCRPSLADGDLAGAQFDYSAQVGDRVYVRTFDTAFSASASPVASAGQPFFNLRVDGIHRTNLAFVGPGPGGVGLAVLVKVPGLTTWMDVGRPDGAGPSKQDAFLDGAGCAVIGPETFDGVDSITGIVYHQIKINVGPAINLFIGDGFEVPVLVKVILKDNATGKGLNFAQGGATGTVANVRGVVGLTIIRP